MSYEPLISVIIPAYNVEKYISEALDSILNQTYQNFEIIIADDGSKDNTRKKIDSYDDIRIKKFHNNNNLGHLKTINKLLSLSRGDFIIFLDADDISDLKRIEKCLNVFVKDNHLGMVGSWGEIITENGKHIDYDIRPETNKDIKKEIYRKSTFLGASVMIKREVYLTIGGYRDFFEYIGYKDYDWTYLVSDNFKTYNIQEPLYKYRQIPTSNSKNVDPKRIVSDKIVQFLGKERRENNGIDSLMKGDTKKVEKYLKECTKPYYDDTSLIYREHASMAMYNKMYKRAILMSIEAIKNNPTKFINWNTLQYCIRKSVFKVFS